MVTHYILKTWLWRHLHNYFLKIMYSLSIMEFSNSKLHIDQLIRLLRNSRIYIEFHSKLLEMTKHGLKNQIIKLSVKSFFVKP
jgi:hypothetical protein